MMWTRHARTDLAHDLLQGRTTSDPRGWYRQQEYPEPGSKRERVGRIALARELRMGDAYFIGLVAAMIDPRTESSIIRQKIEFVTSKDKRRETKTSGRRDVEIAAFMHEWRANHPCQPVESAVAETADHFGFTERIIWDVWKKFKPKPPSEEWKQIFKPRD